MISIQDTYDNLLKAEDLLKYAIEHFTQALGALCEIDDYTVNVRDDFHVPSTYQEARKTDNMLDDLKLAAEKYSALIWELEGNWPELLDDPDAYDEPED